MTGSTSRVTTRSDQGNERVETYAKYNLDTVWRREELRAATAPPRAGRRELSILLFLVSLSAPHLTAQVPTQPRNRTLAPPENLSLLAPPPPPVLLTIRCENSAVDLVLADPLNRRLGNDPAHHQAYDEIPGAAIDSAGLEPGETGIIEEEDPGEVMRMVNPQPGRYTLTLIGAQEGTYSCWILASLENGASAKINLRNHPLKLNQVERVEFRFEPKANSFLVPQDAALSRP